MAKYESVLIDDASPAQLRNYAISFLGIPVSDAMSDPEVLALIKQASDSASIWIAPSQVIDQAGSAPPAQPGAQEPQQSQPLVGGLGRGDPRVSLTLHAEEREGVVVSHHKAVGVNGTVWAIKRGVQVDVPYRVYLALKDAVRDAITHDGEGEVISQKVHAVPFSVQRMPSQEEIDAFHERTRATFCPA